VTPARKPRCSNKIKTIADNALAEGNVPSCARAAYFHLAPWAPPHSLEGMPALFTIGYEQAKPASVLGELRRAKIDFLVDTRAVAASRRPGFSKRQLAASLDENGIAYIHLQKLGTPT
jgi:hypothetical protein